MNAASSAMLRIESARANDARRQRGDDRDGKTEAHRGRRERRADDRDQAGAGERTERDVSRREPVQEHDRLALDALRLREQHVVQRFVRLIFLEPRGQAADALARPQEAVARAHREHRRRIREDRRRRDQRENGEGIRSEQWIGIHGNSERTVI